MIFTDDRKLALSGWLQENDRHAYSDPFCLQNYLFFCEAFSRVRGEEYDFDRLTGDMQGPVFSTVWDDYAKNRAEFDAASLRLFHTRQYTVNNDLAMQADFMVRILPQQELSAFAHSLDIWKAKEAAIRTGYQQATLDDKDFSPADEQKINMLLQMYPVSLIASSTVLPVGNKRYVFSCDDHKRLSEKHADVLKQLSDEPGLINPVFVTIDEGGRLFPD